MNKNENLIGYSLALFSIAKDENKVKEYFEDARILLNLFSTPDYDEFAKIISLRNISQDKKEEIISQTFKNLDTYFLNFLKLISSKNKFHHIEKIIDLFVHYCSDYLRIKEGIVYSSSPLTSGNLKKIENKLSEEYNCKVSLKNLLDKELVSGIKIFLDNTIIENSVISDLEQIRHLLKRERKWD
ncbi:MAG: F0F1 ATP synthase subunit delta [Metamycoplasmataceae bacterium]